MQFDFATAGRILFAPGALSHAGDITKEFSSRALVVTGRNPDRAQPLLKLLKQSGIEIESFSCAGEPTLDEVQAGAHRAREFQAGVVLGYGGGSAIDAAKGIAALTTNTADPLDYLEVIGRGAPLFVPALPVIAIPTTAGTGAEVTRNSVITVPSHQVKVSLRSIHILPKVAIIDPALALGLPSNITAYTGMDALTQLIEPYLSLRANPFTDALCCEAIPRAARALPLACTQPDMLAHREEMALASLFGGIALANAGLGAVHGFASPIGGLIGAPHGLICAALLPEVMQASIAALKRKDASSPALGRYLKVAQLLTGSPTASIEEGVRFVRDLRLQIGVPRLRETGITPESFDLLVGRAVNASSMKSNPVKLEPAELREILLLAY